VYVWSVREGCVRVECGGGMCKGGETLLDNTSPQGKESLALSDLTLYLLLPQFLNVPAFRNVTLKCLTEIGECRRYRCM